MNQFLVKTSPHPTSAHRSTSHRHRLATLLLAFFVGAVSFVAADPAAACVRPPGSGIGCWIHLNGNQVWFIFRRYVTFPVQPGSSCAIGVRMMPSMASFDSATVRNRNTQEPLGPFEFSPNATTSASLAQARAGQWAGFSSGIGDSVPADVPVDLVISGTVVPGTTFEDLRDELIATGDVVGTDESDSEGNLLDTHQHFPVVRIVDAAPPESTPPSGIATPMNDVTVGLRFQDDDDGLRRVRILEAINARAEVPSFDRDTTDPVTVAVSLVDQGSSGFVSIEACNSHGRCIVYDPIVTDLDLSDSQVAVTGLEDVPVWRNRVQVMNGDPGLRYFALLANGRRFSIHPLRGGQVLDLDASLVMADEGTTLRLVGRGGLGGHAIVLIGD